MRRLATRYGRDVVPGRSQRPCAEWGYLLLTRCRRKCQQHRCVALARLPNAHLVQRVPRFTCARALSFPRGHRRRHAAPDSPAPRGVGAFLNTCFPTLTRLSLLCAVVSSPCLLPPLHPPFTFCVSPRIAHSCLWWPARVACASLFAAFLL